MFISRPRHSHEKKVRRRKRGKRARAGERSETKEEAGFATERHEANGDFPTNTSSVHECASQTFSQLLSPGYTQSLLPLSAAADAVKNVGDDDDERISRG